MNEIALYYEKIPDGKIKCLLCPHHCKLKEGQTGLCQVRINEAGILMTCNYGEISSLALDPIEKKPLFHFFPGAYILSAGTFGCNLACSFCQNYSIAQHIPSTQYVKPEILVELAVKNYSRGSIGVAFTYNEPSIWYEYILATAPMLKENGLKTVLITNGFWEKEPLKQLLPFVDALNIDVKAFNEEFYHKMCKGSLKPVREMVEFVTGKTHVEVTTLIIPGLNDRDDEIVDLSRWLSSWDENIILHLSRYHPAYNLNLPPTPESTIRHAQEMAREHLNFVYTGNLPKEENNTYCLECGNVLIKRSGYEIQICGIKNGNCSSCNSPIKYIKGL